MLNGNEIFLVKEDLARNNHIEWKQSQNAMNNPVDEQLPHHIHWLTNLNTQP
jgi:hypothetical protein